MNDVTCIACQTLYPQLIAARANWPTETYRGHECHKFCRSQIDSAYRITTDATIDCTAIKWLSSGNYVPADLMKLARALDLVTDEQVEATETARRAQLDAFLEEYRANQPAEPSEEERASARAAHGPGVKLTNVITGRTFTT